MSQIIPYVVPDLSKWDYYDVNLQDDGVLSADLVENEPVAFAIPYPADAEDPDEVIIVKRIEVTYRHSDGGSFMPSPITDASAGRYFNLEWQFSFFPTSETTEAAEAYRDELKECVAHLFQSIVSPAAEDANGTHAGSFINWPRGIIEFEKPQIFPLNIFCKVSNSSVIVDDGDAVEMANYTIRIYYQKTKMRLGFLGRILALVRQTLSASS